MLNRHRHALLTLAAVQLICLACGLWLQDRFMTSCAAWSQKSQGIDVAAATTALPDAQLREAMPLARWIALIWIGGLQLGASYLVLGRMQLDSTRFERESETQLLHREAELVRTRNAIIFGLARLAEYRDRETGQHLERISLYTTKLAMALRRDPRFRSRISSTFVRFIGISSVLHDIGKVAVSDVVLCKPGPLTPEEREHIKTHTQVGAECILQIEHRLGSSNFLQMAREVALSHHEYWNGAGYPNGISGNAIPLAARILSVADIYDALSARRCYKEPMPHEKCVEIIKSLAGTQLDPDMVDVFLKIEHEFREIADRFTDENKDGGRTPAAGKRTGLPVHTRGDALLKVVMESGVEAPEAVA